MNNLTKEQMIACKGGASYIKATLVSAVTSLIKFVYGVGQDIGTAINNAINGTRC